MLAVSAKDKLCLTCGKGLKGRSDKKFCNDGCRNSFNNRLKGNANNVIREVNNVLVKNRRILESLLIPGNKKTIRVNRERLQTLNFQFNYMTHTYTTKKGNVYYFCYDYGYLPLNNDWYLIVKRKEEQDN